MHLTITVSFDLFWGCLLFVCAEHVTHLCR